MGKPARATLGLLTASPNLDGRAVVVSNCDTPLGMRLVEKLAFSGAHVIAGACHPRDTFGALSHMDNVEILPCHPASFIEMRDFSREIRVRYRTFNDLVFIPPLTTKLLLLPLGRWTAQLAQALTFVALLEEFRPRFAPYRRIIAVLPTLSLRFSGDFSCLDADNTDYRPDTAAKAAASLILHLMHFIAQRARKKIDYCTFLPSSSAIVQPERKVGDTGGSIEGAAIKLTELLASKKRLDGAILEQCDAVPDFVASLAGGHSHIEAAIEALLDDKAVSKSIRFVRDALKAAYPDQSFALLDGP